MSLHITTCRIGKTPVADIGWKHPLPAQNTVQRWHDQCGRSCASCTCGISASMHVIFNPLDFIGKLASLVPKPRVNLTRFHGVFAPNSKHRIEVTPARKGKGRQKVSGQDKMPDERRTAMSWAQRLKRVFTKSRRFRGHRCGNMRSLRWCRQDHRLY